MIERITGLKHEPPIRLQERIVGSGLFGQRRRIRAVVEPTVRIGSPDGPPDGPPDGVGEHTVETRTFSSLDEMPPDLRAEAEKMIAEAKQSDEGGDSGQVLCRYSDSDGKEHVYRSLEEMPPEVRERFERMRRGAGS